MKLRLLNIAQVELDDIIDYYNHQSPGLGDQFLSEINKGFSIIIKFPEAWQLFTDDTRRYLIQRFPYGIIYKTYDNEIVVFAIAHLHRQPDYWIDRIK